MNPLGPNATQLLFRARVDRAYEDVDNNLRGLDARNPWQRRFLRDPRFSQRHVVVRVFLEAVEDAFRSALEEHIHEQGRVNRNVMDPVLRDAMGSIDQVRRRFRYHPGLWTHVYWKESRNRIRSIYVNAIGDPAA